MQTIPTRQLIKTAFFTAPLMALMLVTPLYTLSAGLHHLNFLILWAGATCATTAAWMINMAVLVIVKKPWASSWIRILLVGSIMYGISFIVYYFVAPFLKVERTTIEIIRLINILAVNTIIYILIDLITTKENKNKFALENTNLKLANLEAEYKLLKDQINPHFLFNALSTAKSLIKKQPQLAEEYIIRLSDFLRACINNNRKTISLKEELNMCREFISLNKIRFGEALQFENKISIDMETHFVPYFSILSLIENAIKHNTFTLENPLHISVSAIKDYLEVINNKQKKFVLEDSPKTGLKNLNDRYKLLNANEIAVRENEKEFIVQIDLLKQ